MGGRNSTGGGPFLPRTRGRLTWALPDHRLVVTRHRIWVVRDWRLLNARVQLVRPAGTAVSDVRPRDHPRDRPRRVGGVLRHGAGDAGHRADVDRRELPEWGDFSLAAATAQRPATRRLHVGFAAPSREHVDAFWREGTAAGHPDDGAPGPRPQYTADYYGAFLLDSEGNSAEAVHHGAVRTNGVIDHLWIRVTDVAAAKAFYATIAPYAGLRPGLDWPGIAQFRSTGGSFCLVAGTPTERLHMAFAASEDAAVEAFHRAATQAGHRDDGPPGERPEYHAGYYAGYVLDPDANSVEVVNHHRA